MSWFSKLRRRRRSQISDLWKLADLFGYGKDEMVDLIFPESKQRKFEKAIAEKVYAYTDINLEDCDYIGELALQAVKEQIV